MRYIKNILIMVQLWMFTQSAFTQPISLLTDLHTSAIKNNGVYIVMNEIESASAKKYIHNIQSMWNVSKLQFITYKQLSGYLKAGNYFLSLRVGNESFSTIGSARVDRYSLATGGRMTIESFKHSLSLWTCNDSYLKKDVFRSYTENDYVSKLGNYSDIVYNIPLFVDTRLYSNWGEEIYTVDFSGDSLIYNWGDGIFFNHIRSIQHSIKNVEFHKLAVKVLEKDTLYIPRIATLTYHIGKKPKEQPLTPELMEAYTLKYKLISLEELNAMLLKGDKEFYYVNYYPRSIQIVNSKTGEEIYNSYQYKRKLNASPYTHFEWLNEAVTGKNGLKTSVF